MRQKTHHLTQAAIIAALYVILTHLQNTLPPGTATYKKRRLLLGDSDIAPYVVTSKGSQQLSYNLMLAGLGAFLTTDANVATIPYGDRCRYIALGECQQFCMMYPTATESVVLKTF